MHFNKNKFFHKVTSSLLVLFILCIGISSNVFASSFDTREAAKYYNKILNNNTKLEEELHRAAGENFKSVFYQKNQGYLDSAKKYLDLWQYHKSNIESEEILDETELNTLEVNSSEISIVENNTAKTCQNSDLLVSGSEIIIREPVLEITNKNEENLKEDIDNFIPNNEQWKAIGFSIFEWAENNKYSFIPAGTDIGKFLVKDGRKNIIGEVHSGQPVRYKKGEVYQTHLHLIADKKIHYYF